MARLLTRLPPPFLTKDASYSSISLLKSARVRRSRFRYPGTVISVRRVANSYTDTNLVDETKTEMAELACPVCYTRVFASESRGFNLLAVNGSSFRCKNCQRTFASNEGIIDLTIPWESPRSLGSTFFENPAVAYVYERGYRSLFSVFNFPGFDEEAAIAQRLLQPAVGEVLLDLSCGPGGFTRRFLTSGQYKTIIASDISEAMLEQCRGFLQSDASADMSKVVLVRADAARLPFATSSLAGVHAAAAIHCWPNVLTSVTEISRVLKPGGVFVASTYILPTPSGLEEMLKPARQLIDQMQLPFQWFTENELKIIMETCGLLKVTTYRRGSYIMLSASKPF